MLCLFSFASQAQTKVVIPFKSNNKWGICDTNANIIQAAIFDSLLDYQIEWNNTTKAQHSFIYFKRNGKAIVFKDRQNIIKENQNIEAVDFAYYDANFIKVKKGGKFGCYTNGVLKIPIEYDELSFTENNRVKVLKNSLVGLLSVDNKVIIPVQFAKLRWTTSKDDKSYEWTATLNGKEKIFVDKVQEFIPQLRVQEVKQKELAPATDMDSLKASLLAIREKLTPTYPLMQMVDWTSKYIMVADTFERNGIYDYTIDQEILAPMYDSIKVFEGDSVAFFVVAQNKKMGIIDHRKNILVPVAFDQLKLNDIDLGVVYTVDGENTGAILLSAALSKEGYAPIAPKYKKLYRFKSLLVNDTWRFILFKARDGKGEEFYVGENGKEYRW